MEQNRTLISNAPPAAIPNGTNAQSQAPLQGYNVVTLTPSGNYEQQYNLVFGGASQAGTLPGGAQIPLPLAQKFNNSTLQVNNTSTQPNTSLLAGIYTFNRSSTVPIGQQIAPYQSAGAQTKAQPQTLTLTCTGTEAALAIVLVGDEEPKCYALNTPPDNLPPQWKELKYLTAVAEGFYQVPAKNYYGQFMFIINVSLTPGVKIATNLV